jgi:hypothetical protein
MLVLRMALARQRGHEGADYRRLPRFFSWGCVGLHCVPAEYYYSGGQNTRDGAQMLRSGVDDPKGFSAG